MYLFNTLSRQKEEFIPYKSGYVSIYSCGPTVYGRPHIGNFRSFIFADILRRTLQAHGLQVEYVMNITDVGHLTGDIDEGEDKLAVQAKKEGRTAWEIAKFYTDLFHSDRDAYNILPPTHEPKATDHIVEQIELVKTLEAKGYTYKISDGIYFDTSKLSDYGKLTGQKNEEKLAGARVQENSEKKNSTDFALWKFSPSNEKRHMEWDSPWGKGFPGWHIECSAMSEKYLSTPFDIHTGGVDHIPLHHTNEIAQTEAAREHELARFWLHNEFVKIDGGKMSKSLGNIYTIQDLQDNNFTGLDYRYLCLQTHYRTPLNFTWASLNSAHSAYNNLLKKIKTLKTASDTLPHDDYMSDFMEAMDDDLNTPRALAVLHQLLSDHNISDEVKFATIVEFDHILGLDLIKNHQSAGDLEISEEINQLLTEREQARVEKNWQKSDEIRDIIKQKGYEVMDGPDGQVLHKI